MMRRVCRLAALGLVVAGLQCAPPLPQGSLITPDPSDAGGVVDPAGKLRVLALVVDPPEVMPGAQVNASALVVTHPQQGMLADLGGDLAGRMVRTPTPRGLSVAWRVCRLADEAMTPVPCARGQSMQELPSLPGPATQLVAPAAAGEALPYTLILTLLAADEAHAGGAASCVIPGVDEGAPDFNHCVVAIKRIKVSASPQANHNPGLAGVSLGAMEAELRDITHGSGDYPLLDAGLDDSQRPRLLLAADRAADAVETEPDPQHPAMTRAETLGVSFFSTAGTLEAGRGSFLDVSCAQEPTQCPQLVRAEVGWQPPAARAALEVPDGIVFFFVVLRDDRGGTAVAAGRALAR